MLSSRDGQKRAGNESSASDMWAPWMDDRTTTTYHAQYLDYFRSRKDSTPPFHPALGVQLKTLPDEPFEAGARVQPARRAAVSSKQRTLIGRQQVQRVEIDQPIPLASTLAGIAPPRKSAERTLSQGWHVAPPSAALTAALTPPVLELREVDDEENPFEEESDGLLTWANCVAAGTGLFLAILFGQIVVRASSMELPAAPRAVPVMAAAAAPAPAAPVAAESPAPQPPAAGAVPPSTAAVEVESPRARASDKSSARASRARSADADATEVEPTRSARVRHARADVDAEPTRARRTRDDDAEPSAYARASKSDSAPPAASSAAPGNLRINSRPWSQVSLDGQAIGHTPLIDLRVAPGNHTLRLVNPEFGLSKTVKLKVAPGETVTRVELLEP